MLLSEDLFPIVLPRGLTYLPEFLSLKEEQRLFDAIEQGPWDLTYARRRKHYGKAYQGVPNVRPLLMPAAIIRLATRIHSEGLLPCVPQKALINEYLPGQGIADHLDRADQTGGKVISVSMGSGAEMRFIEPSGRRHHLYLEPRSLLLFQGAARDSWTHGIAGRHSDQRHGITIARKRRVSITLRCSPNKPLAPAAQSQ